MSKYLFLIKLALALKHFKKETPTKVFSCEICEIFKNTFFIEHLRWLLFIMHNFGSRAATPHHILFHFIFFEKEQLPNFRVNIGCLFHKIDLFRDKGFQNVVVVYLDDCICYSRGRKTLPITISLFSEKLEYFIYVNNFYKNVSKV